MIRTNVLLASAVLLAALISACSKNPATAEERADNAMVTEATPANTAASATSVPGEADAANSAELNAAEKPTATTSVKTLPLKRGFYVDSDTPCGQASNATLSLLGRDGFSVSGRDFCAFKRIEKTGATSYRVTEECSSGGAAWGTEEQKDTQVVTWDIANDTSIKRKNESSGWQSSARYCAQPSLPEPWRDNDISDLIG